MTITDVLAVWSVFATLWAAGATILAASFFRLWKINEPDAQEYRRFERQRFCGE